MKRVLFILLAFVLLVCIVFPSYIGAKEIPGKAGIEASTKSVDGTINAVKKNDWAQSETAFEQFKQQWTKVEGDVREESLSTYGKIKTKMAAVSIALLNQDAEKAEESLQELQLLLSQYTKGQGEGKTPASSKLTLSTYVSLLEETKQTLKDGDLPKAKAQVGQLKSQWLTVEGEVVGQSKVAYNNSEKRLVLLDSYVYSESGLKKAEKTIGHMISDLKPLSNTAYGVWDAALIPIREGLEALLVIGALLTFTKRGQQKRGSQWVWGGTIAGILSSIAIGFLVSYVLSSAAFGQNNFLINGWSGVIASVMLLYVSYWLHRNSNIKRWNAFMTSKTEKALSNGKVISFAVLAFLAVLREGIETVIFLVGMANQMSMNKLLAGMGVGFGILIVIGFLMLKLSVRLPLKPFFLVSSIIVFYLCLKFMGSGIHSLQLAGFLPSTVHDYIPSFSTLSVYPSWYSTLPQLIIVVVTVIAFIMQRLNKNKTTKIQSNQEAI